MGEILLQCLCQVQNVEEMIERGNPLFAADSAMRPKPTQIQKRIVSSERVERQEQGDPYSSETSEELLTKPSKNPRPIKMRITSRYGEARIPTYRNGCKNAERILW